MIPPGRNEATAQADCSADFERQFFLPPPHQLAAMFFDQFVAGIGVWIKTEPFVKICRAVIVPPLPLSRIVWQRKGKADVALGHRLADVQLAQAGSGLFDFLRSQTSIAIDGDLGVVAGRLHFDFQHLIGVVLISQFYR